MSPLFLDVVILSLKRLYNCISWLPSGKKKILRFYNLVPKERKFDTDYNEPEKMKAPVIIILIVNM